ncbi:alpha/beta hydrolase [Apibacter raozihei]|uniref:alpha/beta hydrolase n=1 Tax=Apibacter raozihei TaxID=2500547 RepID=UPI000FE39104|nr:alpha/beta hydrolase [Apibacter raozihei]
MEKMETINKEKIFFKNQTLKLAGELYFPLDFDNNQKFAAIIISHPGNGVKEQVAGLYAKKLAENGFISLAFDASHQGESEGLPRYLDDPAKRVEDIRCAVDFLVTLPYIDENKIGAMGICAGAGYAINTAQTEYRIQAVAGISTWDVGDSQRNGFARKWTKQQRNEILQEVALQRTREARGEKPLFVGYVPDSEADFDDDTPIIQREAYEYYCTSRAAHPNSHNKYLYTGNDRFIAWEAFNLLDTLSPRPLLLIVGSLADTIYFSENAYEKANEPKELYIVEGASHVDLYDQEIYVEQVTEKLTDFFRAYL